MSASARASAACTVSVSTARNPRTKERVCAAVHVRTATAGQGRRGLLKVEQLHVLARAVYYGQRGRISAREVYDQMNACSWLTLILACIVYWQTGEISPMAATPDFPFDRDLLRHVSPVEWKNVILYGEIRIDPAKLRIRNL